METFASIISSISGWLYSYILIALLIAAGLYFTVRTGFVQFRLLRDQYRIQGHFYQRHPCLTNAPRNYGFHRHPSSP